ncbi:hypothetical protein Acr_17g0000740 [Actinidia rufa]|uniref:Uncharacterized protein n=1 Tax=Actinidia rufa TaxID=165716 RepID=A0A7J0G0N9_9ERIC|nr:hypothetical protein Acr_17g0000740 [Actinidia rufa]
MAPEEHRVSLIFRAIMWKAESGEVWKVRVHHVELEGCVHSLDAQLHKVIFYYWVLHIHRQLTKATNIGEQIFGIHLSLSQEVEHGEALIHIEKLGVELLREILPRCKGARWEVGIQGVKALSVKDLENSFKLTFWSPLWTPSEVRAMEGSRAFWSRDISKERIHHWNCCVAEGEAVSSEGRRELSFRSEGKLPSISGLVGWVLDLQAIRERGVCLPMIGMGRIGSPLHGKEASMFSKTVRSCSATAAVPPAHLVHVEASSLVNRLEVDNAKRMKLTSLCKSRDQTLGPHLGACKALPLVRRVDYPFKSSTCLMSLVKSHSLLTTGQGEPPLEGSFDKPFNLASIPLSSFGPGACIDVRLYGVPLLGDYILLSFGSGSHLFVESGEELIHLETVHERESSLVSLSLGEEMLGEGSPTPSSVYPQSDN